MSDAFASLEEQALTVRFFVLLLFFLFLLLFGRLWPLLWLCRVGLRRRRTR